MLNIVKQRVFLFDFDGVIVDSVNIKTEAFAELYRPFGEKVISKVVRHHRSHGGMSRFEKIHYYHKQYLNQDLSNSDLMKLANRFSRMVLNKVTKAPFIKGSFQFLKLLKDKNKILFIISGTPEDEIKKIIKKRHLNRFFKDVKGSPLSKQENIERILKKYGILATDCVYFGDSKEDSDAASSVSIVFVGINYSCRKKGYKDFAQMIRRMGHR